MARVAIVSHSFIDNDPRVKRAVDAFLADEWDVDGLFLDDPRREGRLRTWRVPIARKRGGPARYLFEYGTFFVAISLWLIRRLLRSRPDLVYVNSPPDAFSMAAWPAKLVGIPVLLDIHDPMPELLASKGKRRRLFERALIVQERWGVRFADACITVHEPLRDLLQERLGPVPMSIVMNVPDDDSLAPLDWDPTSRTIVYTGTVAARYGIFELVEAVATLSGEIDGLRLRVIGEGEDLDGLREHAALVGAADHVEFLGRIPWDEVRDAQADVWVGVNVPRPDLLGSLSFSNKIVEWITLGLPVIAGRTSTLLRYFPEGTLLYVDAGSVASLEDALRRLDRLPKSAVETQIRSAREALGEIAWPVQRDTLLRTVRGLVGERQ